ncbi:Transposase IS116/IS110/IS902 family protein [uncultured archaeon]|nr:Transposase IS116/IS110/IS902 family protein [uncultured archaeon]
MEKQREIVCGADIHKKFLIATILLRSGLMYTCRFGMTLDELIKFKEWVLDHKCYVVAVESTGVYWVPIYTVLEGKVELLVANAYKIKHTPGKKKDETDSQWIAELCLNGMIEPSRIFPKDEWILRRLTRARESYVNTLTQEKNRIHQALESCCIKLSSVLSDIFGKWGRYILKGLLEGKSVDEIIDGITHSKVKRKADQIREAIKSGLDPSQIFLIKGSLLLMDAIQQRINEVEMEIRNKCTFRRSELAIAMSVPGIGFISAVTILSEIGNITDFESPKKLAAWCGLVPNLYQSADKCILGSITKHGSKHIRRMLVEVARSIARSRNSRLRGFYIRIESKKKANVAAVALARKVLCILHHLLMNNEPYVEGGLQKQKTAKIDLPSLTTDLSVEDIIRSLVDANSTMRKRSSNERS